MKRLNARRNRLDTFRLSVVIIFVRYCYFAIDFIVHNNVLLLLLLLQVNSNPSALDFLLGDDDERGRDQNTPAGSSEVERYVHELQISRNDDPLKWWRNNECRYPCLSSLAKRYLCIPATSASSERVFSTSGNIVTQKRSTLSSENLESLVFLNYNLKRLDE